MEHRSSRKKQTKLKFDPVVSEKSSSPAVKMSPAKVRYQLPTPAKSSQTLGRGGSDPESFDAAAQDTDEDPLALSQPKPYTDLYSAPSDDEEVFTTPLKKNQPVKVPGAFKLLSEKSKKQKNILPSDSEDYDDELAISTPKAKQRTRPPVEDSEEEDEETSILTQDREDTSGEEGDDDEDKVPVASAARRRSRPTIVVSDDEDDEAPVLSDSQRRSVITGNRNKGKGKTVTKQDSDEDDDVITPSPSKRRRSFAISDDEDDDDDEEPVISPLKRRKQDVESDESDIVSSPPKRSRHVIVEDEDKDEDEDEDDESDVPKSKTRATNRKNQSSVSSFTPSRYTRQAKPPKKHRTAKQKAAELLRRKRAGEKIDQLTESSSDDEDGGGLYDSDPKLQALEVFEDEEPSPETSKQATGSASRRNDSNHNANNDDEEEGFIVEDDDDHPLGVPELPLQFSRLAHKPLKENFVDCIEWLIHNNIDPGFPDRKAERYSHAFLKVDDEARGYAISTFVSSQWTAEFTAAIKARPVLTMRGVGGGEGITAEGVPKCDACNHRNHPPKYALSFRGEPYKKSTLEDLEQDSDYEADDEDAAPFDEEGNELVPAGREWFSGRDCSDKAFQAHKLIHWKYSLNEAVIEILESQRHLTQRKIAKRRAASSEERWVYADNIVQAWKADGTIRSLYQEFKKMMDTARTYEPRRYGR